MACPPIALCCLHATDPVLYATQPQKTRVQIWLYENTDLGIEGRIIVSRAMHAIASGWWFAAGRL